MADFVAALANARPDRGDYVLGTRIKFHSHAAERFFRNALRRSAPARMNRRDGVIFRIGEQDRDAVRSLYRKQNSTLPSDECIAMRSAFALREIGRANQINGVGVSLAQQNRTHLAGTDRAEKLLAVRGNTFRPVPFVEPEIQDFFGIFYAALGAFEPARTATTRAETVHQPFEAR